MRLGRRGAIPCSTGLILLRVTESQRIVFRLNQGVLKLIGGGWHGDFERRAFGCLAVKEEGGTIFQVGVRQRLDQVILFPRGAAGAGAPLAVPLDVAGETTGFDLDTGRLGVPRCSGSKPACSHY